MRVSGLVASIFTIWKKSLSFKPRAILLWAGFNYS